MLSTPEFAASLTGAVLFLHVTSHVKSDPNQDLLSIKGGRGFPYLVVMDPHGEVLAKPRERTTDAFASLVGKAAHHVELTERARNGDDVAFDLFLSEMRMGLVAHKQAVARSKKMRGLGKEQKESMEARLLELSVTDACSNLRTNKDRVAAGQKFFKLWRKKRVPEDPEVAGLFWEHVAYFAEKHKNVGLFRKAMESYSASAPMSDSKGRMLLSMRKRLAKMRS